jgi:hypothetical protein
MFCETMRAQIENLIGKYAESADEVETEHDRLTHRRLQIHYLVVRYKAIEKDPEIRSLRVFSNDFRCLGFTSEVRTCRWYSSSPAVAGSSQ